MARALARYTADGEGALGRTLLVVNTTDVPSSLVAEIYDFALKVAGHTLPRVEVTVRNRSGGWTSGRAWPESRPYRIVVSLPRAGAARRWRNAAERNGVRLALGSREEALVFVLAHEVRHILQGHYARPSGRVWGSRGRYSERDCDAFGARVLRAWRRRGLSFLEVVK